MAELTTDTQLAGRFGLTLDKLHDLRLRHGWPHVLLGRGIVRFTEEQIAEIITTHTVTTACSADIGTHLAQRCTPAPRHLGSGLCLSSTHSSRALRSAAIA